MSTCKSIHDKYSVQCTQGEHHVSYRMHLWQGYLQSEDEITTTVVWRDDESREHMDHEREFFAHAERLAEEPGWPGGSYQDIIKELLRRLKEKK